jgi:hypothetical protein
MENDVMNINIVNFLIQYYKTNLNFSQMKKIECHFFSTGRLSSKVELINKELDQTVVNIKNKKGGYKILKRPLIYYNGMFSCLLVLVMFTFTSMGCEKPNDGISSQDDTLQATQDTIYTLAGTKWKLEGILNVHTGEMQTLEPVDCEQCYTLEFDTDTGASGKTTSNILLLNLNIPPYLGVATEVGEMGDGYLFTDILYFITSYKYDREKGHLKFFYQREKKGYCLIFKIL